MSNWLTFIYSKFPLLMQKLVEQLYLSIGSVLIAMAISIPLGIWIARKPTIKNYVLGFCSIMQTLPSLAILGFLLPFLGIGIKTAMVTLVLYAILPIVRNTVTSFLGIRPELLEAADGLGFTRWQKMRLVELPLAMPVIVAGVRTATAMTVGIATLAAFIGAGGLGDFIYEGLSLNNVPLILLGAIPAALLALILDYTIGKFEKMLIRKKRGRRKRTILKLALTIFVLIALLATFFIVQRLHGYSQNQVRIGTKNFTEQLILGELLAQLLEANTNLHVVKRFNLGGTFVCHEALVNGEIDMYPEYTGTGYVVILKETTPRTPQQIYDYLISTYKKRFDILWLPIFGFNNSNAVAVKQQFAKANGITKISDLKPLAKKLSIGVPADFLERPDGFIGLKQHYGLTFGKVRLMDAGLMYKAIQHSEIDAIMAFSTDGRIPAYQLQVLIDDRHLFPPYYAAPVVRGEVIKRHPEIESVLNKLAGKITNEEMQNLNYQVDVLHKTPEEVAKSFLQKI